MAQNFQSKINIENILHSLQFWNSVTKDANDFVFIENHNNVVSFSPSQRKVKREVKRKLHLEECLECNYQEFCDDYYSI